MRPASPISAPRGGGRPARPGADGAWAGGRGGGADRGARGGRAREAAGVAPAAADRFLAAVAGNRAADGADGGAVPVDDAGAVPWALGVGGSAGDGAGGGRVAVVVRRA